MPRYHSRAERAADLLQSRRSTVESVAKQTGLPVDIVRQINEPIAKRRAEQDAVDAACEEYDISLTDEEKAQIVDLLLKLSKLNLDADTINKAQKLLDSLTSVTDSGSQIGTFFANLWKAISDFFQNLFG